MIHVQHLLGVGHLQRSLQLAVALAHQQFQVELVSGGMPQAIDVPDGIRFRQLPPLYSADGSFKHLFDADGNEIDDAWRERRKQQLLDLFTSFAPQVLITETFPFGRRMLRFELLPLLQAARNSSSCVQVISSIRDILQPKSKPGRNREICEFIEQYYDQVLVHGDESIARLADSFELAQRIESKLYYSGYICASRGRAPAANEGDEEVLVSAGGSATGLRILQTAIATKPRSTLHNLRWRLLVSPAVAAASFEKLRRLAGPGICVERNRPDFSELVKRARLSISQAGYNTITDILNSDTASVVIPFAEADEIEQTLRARRLHDRGRLVALAQQDLSTDTLAWALATADEGHSELVANLDGARNSALMVERWLASAEAGR
ncbi:MAG: glycosyl transferase [Gammaproteobacteria bacterium]|nr:glycosyl transferase [Gammaproteobacteria bacterium]